MKRVLIITGGRSDKALAKELYSEFAPDMVITADRGMEVARELGIVPDYLVGDFDSSDNATLEYFKSQFATEGRPIIRTFNAEKDETDTELAISLALVSEASEIVILGATGTRLDHTLANIHILCKPLESGVKALIIDEYNVISLHDEKITLKADKAFGEYFSLMPLSESVKNLTIKGAKYELEKVDIAYGSSLCVSNEFAKNTVKIDFDEGKLILFQTSDTGLKIRGKM